MVPDCVLQVESKLGVDACQLSSNKRIVRIEAGLKRANLDQHSSHILQILHPQF